MTGNLVSIISGWTSIGSAWNDKKSEKIENEVIIPLEHAIQELNDRIEEIAYFGQNVEEQMESIERTGGMYG